MIHRRTLLTGLAGLIASPAIVRASSLMPVRAWANPMTATEVLARQQVWEANLQKIIAERVYPPILKAIEDMMVYGTGMVRSETDGYPVYVSPTDWPRLSA